MKLPLALALFTLPGLAADAPTPAQAATTPPAGAPAPAPSPDSAELRQLLQRGLFEEEASREYGKAAAAYSTLLSQYESHRALAATALFRLAEIRVKQGTPAEAIPLYQRLLAEFPGQEPLAGLSRARLAKLSPDAANPTAPTPGTADTPTAEETAELARLREIATNSPDLLQADQGAGTPLERAASRGQVRAVAFLLDQKVSANGRDGDGKPLANAAQGGHKKAVELLLERGAAVNPPADKPIQLTALGAACSAGRSEVIKALLERGADPNAVDAQRRTPLSLLLLSDGPYFETAQRLLEKGAKLNVSSPYYSPSPIPAGAEASRTIDTPPLTQAVAKRDLALVKLFLDKGADPNFDSAVPTIMPLEVAIRQDNDAIAILLLEKGAKPDLVIKTDPGNGTTNRLLNDIIFYYPERARLLLKYGASKTLLDSNGDTPLQRTLRWAINFSPGKLNAVSPGGNPTPRPNNTRGNQVPVPPMSEKNFQVLKALCEDLLTGPDAADINAQNKAGDTALHYALQRADSPEDFIRWLISKGADPQLENKAGKTPIETAHLAHIPTFEPEFLYPKIQRKDAIAVVGHLGWAHKQPEYLIGDTSATPPNFANLLFKAFVPEATSEPTLRVENPMLPPFSGGARIPAEFTALIFRPDAAGKFAQAEKFAIVFSNEARIETWPALRWGDVVLFYAKEPSNSKFTLSNLRPWLEAVGGLKPAEPAPERPNTQATPAQPAFPAMPAPPATRPPNAGPGPNKTRDRIQGR